MNFTRVVFFSVFMLCMFFSSCHAQKLPKPNQTYLVDGNTNKDQVEGEYRVLELEGRKGINTTSIHSLIKFPKHNLNSKKGSLTYWVFPLENVSTFLKRDVMFTDENKNPWIYPLLSDNADLGEFTKANFLMTIDTGWHPVFVTKFYEGDIFVDALNTPKKAYAMASSFELHKNKWYQFTLTWDFDKEEILVYANGVVIASSDIFHPQFHRDTIGETLYSGLPLYCFGEMNFYDEVLTKTQVVDIFKNESIEPDKEFQKELETIYGGQNLEDFTWKPNEEWKLNFSKSMKEKDLLKDFYIQGNPINVEVTNEGLHIQTPKHEYFSTVREKQMYLWNKTFFEGDIYIEYEFRPNKQFGLSLLMFQASGMSREDFMKDYEPRTSGTMSTVHSSDVRNYHLEYYRNMNAVRNEVATAALVKNPYQFPLGFGTFDYKLETGTWHKLQVLQKDNKITVAINGKKLFTAEDKPFSNNGPILNSGHFAIRCMIDTDMHFRDIKVYNRNLPYKEILRK